MWRGLGNFSCARRFIFSFSDCRISFDLHDFQELCGNRMDLVVTLVARNFKESTRIDGDPVCILSVHFLLT